MRHRAKIWRARRRKEDGPVPRASSRGKQPPRLRCQTQSGSLRYGGMKRKRWVARGEVRGRSLRREVSEHWPPGPKAVPVAGADRKLRAGWQACLLIVVAPSCQRNSSETEKRNEEPELFQPLALPSDSSDPIKRRRDEYPDRWRRQGSRLPMPANRACRMSRISWSMRGTALKSTSAAVSGRRMFGRSFFI